jgi:excisionase family DNA binding protein
MLHPLPDPPPVRREFYSLTEVAYMMHLSVSRVRQFVAAGELGSHKLGGQVRINTVDLERFFAERKRELSGR